LMYNENEDERVQITGKCSEWGCIDAKFITKSVDDSCFYSESIKWIYGVVVYEAFFFGRWVDVN
jgi:hypothetical protein